MIFLSQLIFNFHFGEAGEGERKTFNLFSQLNKRCRQKPLLRSFLPHRSIKRNLLSQDGLAALFL